MQVLVIENADSAPVALFGDWLADLGATLTIVGPQALPETPEGYDLVVTLGSANGAYEDLPWINRQRDFLRAAADADQPIVAICFGAQLLASAIGGRAAHMGDRRFVGWHSNETVTDPIWAGPWLRWHEDHLEVPDTADVLARDHGTVQAYQYRRAVGVQFHPEAGEAQVARWAAARDAKWTQEAGMTVAGLVAQSRDLLASGAAARNALFAEMLRRALGQPV